MAKSNALTIVLLLTCFANPWVAEARTNLRPDWTRRPVHELNPNDLFLMDLEKNASARSDFHSDEIFKPKAASEFQFRYDDMVRNYEMRRKSGLVDQREERDHQERLGGLGREILNQIRAATVKKELKSVETAVMRDEALSSMVKPVVFAGAVTAACMGTPVQFPLSKETKVTATTNVVEQTSQVQVASPVVRGEVSVAAKLPEGRPEPGATQERYRFSLFKDLPVLGATSGVSYGGTTNSLTTSLSKQVLDNLTCVVDSTRPLYAETGSAASQETVRLLYGLSF